MVCMCMMFSRRRKLLQFYDSTTSLIAVWNNTYVLLFPMVLDIISGAESLQEVKVETRTSTGIIRAMIAVMVCGFCAKVNTLHLVGISLHALSCWIICASLQGSTVHELICPLLSVAFLLASCIMCVRKLHKLEHTTFLETSQVSLTLRKSKEVQERLGETGEACSILLSAFCEAVFMTDMDFRIVTHQEHYCSIRKLNSLFGQDMDDQNLWDHLYDLSEQQRFNTCIADTPLTTGVSFNLRFRVSQQHSETDLLETTMYVVPTEHGRLVAIVGQARLCRHEMSEGKKNAHEVMLPGSLNHTSVVTDADAKINEEHVEHSTEKENSDLATGCTQRVNPQGKQLKPIRHPPRMKEHESSQSHNDSLAEIDAQKLAPSVSIDEDTVIFANTAVSSTVVPGNDQEDLYDPNGWPSQETSTFFNSVSNDWGMTAQSSTWKADRASSCSYTASIGTWQKDVSEVDALRSKLEAERLSNAVVRYTGLLTASCALVVGDMGVAEARAEIQRHQEVEKASAAIDFLLRTRPHLLPIQEARPMGNALFDLCHSREHRDKAHANLPQGSVVQSYNKKAWKCVI